MDHQCLLRSPVPTVASGGNPPRSKLTLNVLSTEYGRKLFHHVPSFLCRPSTHGPASDDGRVGARRGSIGALKSSPEGVTAKGRKQPIRFRHAVCGKLRSTADFEQAGSGGGAHPRSRRLGGGGYAVGGKPKGAISTRCDDLFEELGQWEKVLS